MSDLVPHFHLVQVLVAYDAQQDTFQVSDPGVAAERRAIKKESLDRARKQHGEAAAG